MKSSADEYMKNVVCFTIEYCMMWVVNAGSDKKFCLVNSNMLSEHKQYTWQNTSMAVVIRFRYEWLKTEFIDIFRQFPLLQWKSQRESD